MGVCCSSGESRDGRRRHKQAPQNGGVKRRPSAKVKPKGNAKRNAAPQKGERVWQQEATPHSILKNASVSPSAGRSLETTVPDVDELRSQSVVQPLSDAAHNPLVPHDGLLGISSYSNSSTANGTPAVLRPRKVTLTPLLSRDEVRSNVERSSSLEQASSRASSGLRVPSISLAQPEPTVLAYVPEPDVKGATGRSSNGHHSDGDERPYTQRDMADSVPGRSKPDPSPSSVLLSPLLPPHRQATPGPFVTIDDRVYNFAPLLATHPGGAAILKQYDGKDATVAFHASHNPAPVHALAKYTVPREL